MKRLASRSTWWRTTLPHRSSHAVSVLARRLAEVIAALRQTGLSAILSESSLAHAHGLLDRVFVIDRGAVSAKP